MNIKVEQVCPLGEASLQNLHKLSEAQRQRSQEIFSEMVNSYADLQDIKYGVTIYGSARVAEDAPLYAETVRIGKLLAEAGYHVITGGGPGLMAAGNRGAHDAGKESTGLRIRLPHEQHTNPYMTNICYFNNFMTRKYMFMMHSRAYIVMSGGLGTLDELSEIFVLVQTGKVPPAPIILYSTAYWQPFIDWLRQTLAVGGFIKAEDVDLLHLADSPEEAVGIVKHFVPIA